MDVAKFHLGFKDWLVPYLAFLECIGVYDLLDDETLGDRILSAMEMK